MRMILLATSLVVLSASAAFAGDEVMADLYGNTIVSKGGMAETHSYYNADHTFRMTAPAFGMEWKGTWKIDGATLCRTFETAPPGTANPLCTPVEAHKVGENWTSTVNGKTRDVSLVKGIQ